MSTETTQGKGLFAKRKSVALTTEERKALKKYIKGFGTVTEAAISLRVSREVLNRIQLVGSGSPDSISIIRKKLNTAA